RERGITTKAHSVALDYRSRSGDQYLFNLIDTPGHVDFTYEVSRSLSACEGALLVVDATQGVEAQTLANAYMAIEGNLSILPVINKIDVQSAEPERTRDQIRDVIGLDATDATLASAKEGIGIEEILEAIIARVPAPQGDPEAPPRALIFDSWYDAYRGVIMLVRVIEGTIVEKQRIRLMATGRAYDAEEVGIYTPKMKSTGRLSVGEVGYIVAGIKNVSECQIGDTVTEERGPAATPFP